MRFAIIWVALLSSGAAAAKAPDPSVATVTDLRGDVGHQRNLDEIWNSTSLDEAMFLLDLIRTGKRSTTEIRFIDRTLLALGEKTRMKITIGLFNVQKTAPKLQAAIKAAQLRLASQTKKQSLTQASVLQTDTTEVVRIRITTGSLTLAVDSAARFYRIEGPNEQVLFIAPGDRVRVSVVDGQLVVEAIPQGFSFAADFLFEAWDEELFGPESGVGIGIGSGEPWANGPTGANPENEQGSGNGVPGSLNPLDDLAIAPTEGTATSPAVLPTGIVLDVAPRGDDN